MSTLDDVIFGKKYVLIDNEEKLEEAIFHLKDSEYVAYDTETTGLNVRKDKIIGFSFTGKPKIGYYFPVFFWNKYLHSLMTHSFYTKERCDELLSILKTKKLIMHNASFDIRVTINYFKFNFLSSLHADTQLMEHTLNEEGPFALKQVCTIKQKQLGLDSQDFANQEQLELKESVLENGGKWVDKQKDIYKGDLGIISKYACADVDLTLRLFKHNEERLLKENLHDFFYNQEVMPLQKYVTIRMEHRGVHIDLHRLQELHAGITADILEYEKEVVEALYTHPAWAMYIESKLNDISISNKGSFAQELCRYAGLDLPISESGKFSINKKSIEKLPESNWKAFLYYNNPHFLHSQEIKDIRIALYKKENETEYLINIQSKTQLGDLVFNYVRIEPLTKTAKGSPQFNEDFVESISKDHPWAEKLRVYNKLNKIKSSYYDRFIEKHEDGVYYPTFKQHGTTSGRYSSDFQQLPRPKDEDSVEHELVKKYNDSIRELVIPAPGYMFIDDDYESLEPRCFADDAGDEALIRIFIDNLDMYSVVAIMAEDIKDASADKKAPNFLKKKYPNVRQNAKAYALGIRYGMKEFKLAKSLDISEDKAAEIIRNYFKAFPGLKAKMDKYLKEVKTTGKVTSKFGRVRHLPRAKEIYEKFGDGILDFRNLKKISIKTKVPMDELRLIRKEYNNLLNNALNFPIQSTATSIVNRAAIAMTKKFIENKMDAWVSLQIHDQLVATCREDICEDVKPVVQSSMEDTNKLAMPLVAKPEVAKNLREGH
jgi:DNA polymerase I-like protein with 3'-5' exonuclease and polymerase domains